MTASAHEINDGFKSIGLLRACSVDGMEHLADVANDAPGHDDSTPVEPALTALVAADAKVTEALVQAAVPGWYAVAGGRRSPGFPPSAGEVTRACNPVQ